MTCGRPNILVFFSDQQRWDTVGCYGQPMEVTPNLDRMASEGARFERALTCQPVCGPARACIQTGRYATETGCFRNGIALPLGERTIAHRLREAGYEAGYIGKWHLASTHGQFDFREAPVPPERRGGYDDYWLASDVLEYTSHSHDGHMFDAAGRRVEFPEGRYRVDCLGDYAIEYLRTRDGRRPFFLFLSFIEPHHQNDHNRYEGPRGSKERFADFPVPGDLADTRGDWRDNYPDYLGCCAALDENLGRVLAELDRLGVADETLVIYTSDHGSHFRTRNREYKRSCHEGCIRIPMIARGPGFRGGAVAAGLVSLIDLPPTILAAGGVTPPPSMRGRPLQRLLLHPPHLTGGGIGRVSEGGTTCLQTAQAWHSAGEWRSEVFIQVSESHVGRAIRTERWKYSVRAPGKHGWDDSCSDRYVEDHLYDLAADPHERNNLAADPSLAAVRAELAEALKRHMAEAGEDGCVIEPAPETLKE